MKINNFTFVSIKKIPGKFIILPVLLLIISFSACNSDDVGGNLYTFTDRMMGQYLENDTTLSEFSKMVSKTKVDGFLNTYGEYTCFAPTNKALRNYYKLKGKKSMDDFSPDTLKTIVYDHLISGKVYTFASFINGRLPDLTMSDRHITITFTDTLATFVNKTSRILFKDILVHNGIIHTIDKVIDPTNFGISLAIKQDTTFSIFYEALEKTGLVDSLNRLIDKNYSITAAYKTQLENAVVGAVGSENYAPTSRKYGYTVLAESNATMRANGITDLESLKNYAAGVYDEVYPEDAGISSLTNRFNSLNRFIAYHLINKEIDYNKFIFAYDTNHQIKTRDLYEYIEPMCPNTLIEVKLDRYKPLTFLLDYTPENGKYVEIVKTNSDIAGTNGVYHEINGMLVYNRAVENELSSKRLRFDFASLFPELTNNNMRGRASDNNNLLYRYALPPGYLENIKCNNDQTVIGYTTPNDKLMNFEGDEFFIQAQNGNLYDFDVTTPPIPEGNYEVRFAFQTNGRRGVAQFYVDDVPCGVPVNLNKGGTDVAIGYISPGSDAADPNGFENDKMMRNNGYMKGPGSFKSVNTSWYSGSSARYNGGNLRKILGTFPFSKPGKHKISVKGLSSGQFQIDFIEFVPTSAIEFEDIN